MTQTDQIPAWATDPEVLGQVVRRAREQGDWRGIEAALVLLAACDPQQAHRHLTETEPGQLPNFALTALNRRINLAIVQPLRIQRSRSAGWRLPAGGVCIDRTSKWGNPWTIRETASRSGLPLWTVRHATQDAVLGAFADRTAAARRAVMGYHRDLPADLAAQIPELAGKPLACYCPLTRPGGRPFPCHGLYLALRANLPEVDPWTHVEAVTPW